MKRQHRSPTSNLKSSNQDFNQEVGDLPEIIPLFKFKDASSSLLATPPLVCGSFFHRTADIEVNESKNDWR